MTLACKTETSTYTKATPRTAPVAKDDKEATSKNPIKMERTVLGFMLHHTNKFRGSLYGLWNGLPVCHTIVVAGRRVFDRMFCPPFDLDFATILSGALFSVSLIPAFQALRRFCTE
jgi:hypothetical protein